jgi:hypothetical protein
MGRGAASNGLLQKLRGEGRGARAPPKRRGLGRNGEKCCALGPAGAGLEVGGKRGGEPLSV